MRNNPIYLSLILILGISILIVGCRKVVPEDVISSVIDAYSEIKTYSAVEKMSAKTEVIGGDRPGIKYNSQNGTGKINIANRQCEMDIIQDGQPRQGMQTFIKQYLINEWLYGKADFLDYEDKDHEVWVKLDLGDEQLNRNDRLWKERDTLGQLIELLNTAGEVIILQVEKYNDINTYVLDIKPDWQIFTDWISGKPPWRAPSRYNFPELSRYLSIRLWVCKETFLIVKSEIETTYEIVSADSSSVTENFTYEIYLNDYNRPVEIKLPEEALKAIRGPIS